MKLRNKKTGEIKSLSIYGIDLNIRDKDIPVYHSLKELNDEWEDAPEEPKEYWYIDCYGTAIRTLDNGNEWDERRKEIGNRFETEEEAEKAAERLRAWTRLESKGLKIRLRSLKGYNCLEANWGVLEGDYSDVRLLFGGEE